MKTYHVKEMFGPTLQGEGRHSGRSCVFVRLSGCNAWNGQVETKAASACPYCDTDFVGGTSYDSDGIVDALNALCVGGVHGVDSELTQAGRNQMGCVLTGGEPLLQADIFLIEALARAFAWVDIETNGTQLCPQVGDRYIDKVFISCSPKQIKNTNIVVNPDWWKILIPAQESFLDMACASGKPVYVQPVSFDDDVHSAVYQANLQRCVELCYQRGLRMSVQLHKYLNLQ